MFAHSREKSKHLTLPQISQKNAHPRRSPCRQIYIQKLQGRLCLSVMGEGCAMKSTDELASKEAVSALKSVLKKQAAMGKQEASLFSSLHSRLR